jgi:hypothetical protein
MNHAFRNGGKQAAPSTCLAVESYLQQILNHGFFHAGTMFDTVSVLNYVFFEVLNVNGHWESFGYHDTCWLSPPQALLTTSTQE